MQKVASAQVGPALVLRRPTRWLLSPVAAEQPHDVDVTTVIRTLHAADGPAAASADRVPSSLRPRPAPGDVDLGRRLRLGGCASFLVVPEGLLVWGPDGPYVHDEPDVVLLDLLGQVSRVEALLDAAEATLGLPRDELVARSASLVESGVVHRRARRGSTADATGDGDATGSRARFFRPAPGARKAHPAPPLLGAAPEGPAADRIPVLAPWDDSHLPLGLGMVTAHARSGRVAGVVDRYDVRPPRPASEVLDTLTAGDGPAVLLCSNYQWTLDSNLALAAEAKLRRPGLVVVHGGPSTPKYEADVARFFEQHAGAADVAARGEGETTTAELLAALTWVGDRPDLGALHDVAGLSFRGVDGTIVRTADRERSAELDELPSPYLTGEFGAVEGHEGASLETNRGCPYGCTFCDWGSATLSRVRSFGLDRVEAEMRWLAERGIHDWTIADANFGIFKRDVQVAELVVEMKREHGVPDSLAFCLAKNTTRHLVQIVDLLTEAGIGCYCSLSLQTRDEATLAAVDRTNIKTDHYSALAADFRQRGLPLIADLMLGLPGQTVESYRDDLQFLLDREMLPRTWPTQVLPNAPLNDPSYRERFGLEVSDGLLVAAASFTREDRDEMLGLRLGHAALEQFGILRHVLRFLQWEHDLPAMQVVQQMVDDARHQPLAYPLLSWLLRTFDLHPVPPVGWEPFFEEVRAYLDERLEVPPSAALDVVLAVQQHLLPARGRSLPARLDLDHDYVAYYDDATRGLWADGEPTTPSRPLASYGPGVLVVEADPSDLCGAGLGWYEGTRDERSIGSFWLNDHWELDSVLTMNLADVHRAGGYQAVRQTARDRGHAADLGDGPVLSALQRSRTSLPSLPPAPKRS